MDVEKWFEVNYRSKVNDETRNQISCFPIIWLIFDKEVANNDFSSKTLPSVSNALIRNNIDFVLVESLFSDMKNYINSKYDGYLCDIYISFRFRTNDISIEEVERLYNSNLNEDKLILLLWLSYRVRNNMFHGIKEIEDLNSQTVLFSCLNKFLISCIETSRGRFQRSWNGK